MKLKIYITVKYSELKISDELDEYIRENIMEFFDESKILDLKILSSEIKTLNGQIREAKRDDWKEDIELYINLKAELIKLIDALKSKKVNFIVLDE